MEVPLTGWELQVSSMARRHHEHKATYHPQKRTECQEADSKHTKQLPQRVTALWAACALECVGTLPSRCEPRSVGNLWAAAASRKRHGGAARLRAQGQVGKGDGGAARLRGTRTRGKGEVEKQRGARHKDRGQGRQVQPKRHEGAAAHEANVFLILFQQAASGCISSSCAPIGSG